MTCPSVFGIMEAAGQEMIIFAVFKNSILGQYLEHCLALSQVYLLLFS